MILLSDNDLLVKLAQCNLIDVALASLNAGPQHCYVLDTMKYSLRLRDPDLSIRKYVGSTDAYDRINHLLSECNELPAAPLGSDLVDHMSKIPQIDPGEFALFLHAQQHSLANSDYRLLTGDKRALKAICEYGDFHHFEFLCSQVCCLESCMLGLIQNFGFDYINSCVTNAKDIVLENKFDKVLRAAFGTGKEQQNCTDCLYYYFSDLSRIFPSYFS